MKLSNFLTIILLWETLIFTCTKQFSYILLTVKLLACQIVKLTFSTLDIKQSKWNCHAMIAHNILYQITSTFHSSCVCKKFQSKKLNYKTHSPIYHLQHSQMRETFENNSGSTCMWKSTHFSMLFQSLVARHLQEVCWKWTLLGSTSSFVVQIWCDTWSLKW